MMGVLLILLGSFQKELSINSNSLHRRHGGILTTAVWTPDGRFFIEGEWGNPEQNKRKACITVKDLNTGQIHGQDILL